MRLEARSENVLASYSGVKDRALLVSVAMTR